MRFLLLILCALLSVSGVGAQEDLPPYIHYFDHLRGGLVIERADGTDSRMIPDVPTGHIEWSPSGKWMMIGKNLISTDGSVRDPLPLIASLVYDTRPSVTPQYLWAPFDDTLLIVGTDSLDYTTHARLIDIAQEKVLADFELQISYPDFSFLDLYWQPDGTRAFASWPGYVITLYRDGRSALWHNELDSHFARQSDFYQGRLFSVARWTTEVLTLRFETLNGEKQIDIEDQTGQSRNDYTVRWSPTLEHALIYAWTCSDEACNAWLKLVDWETGAVNSLTPAIRIEQRGWDCYWYACTELWSPDERYAVLWERSADTQNIYILDVSTATMRQVISGEQVGWYSWSPDGLLYVLFENDRRLVEYDPATGGKREIDLPSNTGSHYLSFSPNGQYIGLASVPAAVINQSGETVVQAIQHSHSTHSTCCPLAYDWHSSGQWLMADYVISFAGGGYGPLASVVFNLDGTTRRELPTGGGSSFLPERVAPHLPAGQPKSAKKEPILTIQHDGLVYYIGWHPTDPDRFVTYSDGLIFWSLKDGEPKITDRIVPRTPLLNPHPVGLQLFWLPEGDIVAIYNFDTQQWIDLESGEIVSNVETEFPVFPEEHFADSRFGLPRRPTSDLSGFIVAGVWPDDDPYYIDASTGRVVLLDIESEDEFVNLYTADAREGIAVIGAVLDCCVTVFSTEDGRQLDRFYGTAVSLAISGDGRRLATTSAGMTAIWDISEYTAGE